MGMTNDFEAAVEEGSNIVRIGRAGKDINLRRKILWQENI